MSKGTKIRLTELSFLNMCQFPLLWIHSYQSYENGRLHHDMFHSYKREKKVQNFYTIFTLNTGTPKPLVKLILKQKMSTLLPVDRGLLDEWQTVWTLVRCRILSLWSESSLFTQACLSVQVLRISMVNSEYYKITCPKSVHYSCSIRILKILMLGFKELCLYLLMHQTGLQQE